MKDLMTPIEQIVWNYLGLDDPEKVREWIIEARRLMTEGGEVIVPDGTVHRVVVEKHLGPQAIV